MGTASADARAHARPTGASRRSSRARNPRAALPAKEACPLPCLRWRSLPRAYGGPANARKHYGEPRRIIVLRRALSVATMSLKSARVERFGHRDLGEAITDTAH